MQRGEIWMYSFAPPDKRRPVVVLSRSDAIAHLHTVLVASVTSSIRGVMSEVPIGPAEGLKHDSAVNLDFVNSVPKHRLKARVGSLSPACMDLVCQALEVAVGCNNRIGRDS